MDDYSLVSRQLPRLKAGKPISAKAVNATIDAVERSRPVVGSGNGIALAQLPNGFSFRALKQAACIYIQSPGGGIPARSGTTLGSASCTWYIRQNAALVSTGRTVTVYNASSTAVAASRYGVAGWDGDGWVVLVESCA